MAGVQISQVNQDTKGQLLIGYKAGVLGEFRLTTGDFGRIYLQSGALFVKKGFSGGKGVPLPAYNASAIEVPFFFDFDINLFQQVNSFFRVGLYYSYSFGKVEGAKRDDYGVQIGFGAEYRRWMIAFDSSIGKYNIIIGDGVAKHRAYGLTIGHRF